MIRVPTPVTSPGSLSSRSTDRSSQAPDRSTSRWWRRVRGPAESVLCFLGAEWLCEWWRVWWAWQAATTAGSSWAGTRIRGFQFLCSESSLLPWRLWMLQHSLCQGCHSFCFHPLPLILHFGISLVLLPFPNPSFPLQCSRVFLLLLLLLSSVLKSWLVRNQGELCCSLWRGTRAFSPHLFLLSSLLLHKHLCVLVSVKSLVAQYSRVKPASRTHKGNSEDELG